MFLYCIYAGIIYTLKLRTTEVKGAFIVYVNILSSEGFGEVDHVGTCGGHGAQGQIAGVLKEWAHSGGEVDWFRGLTSLETGTRQSTALTFTLVLSSHLDSTWPCMVGAPGSNWLCSLSISIRECLVCDLNRTQIYTMWPRNKMNPPYKL